MTETTEQKVRLVTAAALFDGHDAAINIMRRILQSKGAEIIHLGHNRSVAEIVECAIEEDVQGIAITSYQGGHVEFFKYMKDLLVENGCGHIKIFGGGGGTILPAEIEELHNYGITRIYSPDDGRHMGLGGMIQDVIDKCKEVEMPTVTSSSNKDSKYALGEFKDIISIARKITAAENGEESSTQKVEKGSPVLGITGTGGAGKSSVTDEIVRRFLNNYTDKTIAVISVDPSKKKTGGALLGDRIRMNSISSPRAYMRSLATRESDKALSNYVTEALQICKQAAFDLIILESAGVGQSDASILEHCDVSMYVMTPEYGAPSQLEKINMLDYADVICLNKFDKAGALDALHDVRKQYKRNYELWDAKDEDLPVVGTIAAQFNDAGVNTLFDKLIKVIAAKTGSDFGTHAAFAKSGGMDGSIIPPKRVRYLAEISETINEYNKWVKEQAEIATKLYQLNAVIKMMDDKK
jgi:isobutyryl-CoA mutase